MRFHKSGTRGQRPCHARKAGKTTRSYTVFPILYRAAKAGQGISHNRLPCRTRAGGTY